MKYLLNSIGKLCFALFAFFLFSAFTPLPDHDEQDAPERLVTLRSDEFNRFASTVYRSIDFKEDTVNEEVFDQAFRGYMFLRKTGQLESTRYLSIIDFTKHCNSKRFYIIDLETKELVFSELVAHGVNTGKDYALNFSNTHRSNKSSLGFYVTGGTYYGRNGLSLKLHGLEKNFNTNAYARGIVIHGAHYVNEKYIERNERIGRSFGCPAVSQQINAKLVNTIKGGNCLFIYHNAVYYSNNSELVNANLYVPVDDLSL
ncbi:murein L,D-transpeptidase catalytic domain family protein [bacterium]|nr:murein L,D-transpeptidase catalytic domain family protein [bacterium]